jgi:hypothetical protein
LTFLFRGQIGIDLWRLEHAKQQDDAFSFVQDWNIVSGAGAAVSSMPLVGEDEVPMVLRMTAFLGAVGIVLGSILSAGQAAAQEKAIAIELNKATNAEQGCRLTFVVKNDTPSLLEKTSYEIAAFDASKTVMKLLVFEFGRLPAGKTKVVEFALAGVGCPNISRILINTSPECIADGAASTICLDALRTSSLTRIVFDQ